MANSEFSIVGLAHKLLLAAEQQGFNPTSINTLAESPKVLADMLAVMEGRSRIVPIEAAEKPVAQAVRNTLTVLPNLTLAQRIALGNYGEGNVNSDITEKRFPHDTTTIGEWEYKLIHLNKKVSSEDAKTESETDGFTSAKAEHLLAFGEAFPEEQRKYPIVALGSVCEVGGGRIVLGLWDDCRKRRLYLHWWRGDWIASYRFLVVRKVQSSKT